MKHTLEVFREFLLLGLTSFGGPTAHVAFFRDRFVGVKKWLSESDFADLRALCQFLPGPASSQLGLSIGWRRAGWAGAFAAWFAFTMPSAILLTLFGIGVMKFGGGLDAETGWLRGLQIAVVVVIAQAVTSMWTALCPDRKRKLIALATAAIILVTAPAWMQLVVIALGAVAGLIFLREETIPEDSTGLDERPNPVRSGVVVGVACLVLFFVLLIGLPFVVRTMPDCPVLQTFTAMYRSGSLVFGGGHVVLPLLSYEVVDPGWIKREEFLAGYGAAQAVPGPLFTFAAFLGSLIDGPGGPWGMAAVALIGIFVPAWLLVLGVMPFWHRVVAFPKVRAALAGTNAAVVGLLGAALYDPVWAGAIANAKDVVFLLGVAAALLVLRIPAWGVVIAGGGRGWVLL
ncbi:MAG: chromate efflux transporter [Verrucomicrobiota bacterium]